ncbi:MAG: OmpH family outer membrane protein [Saprospiraceae bacterium]|jgi:outer membrane protein|nr:OmpH family outer membrane protein [Saprospiraceae bacterium]MBP6237920.1 OmpH family outer membrane protein [Saprospiraceae bacterium]MBP6567120.1 OmpH family outer membrane protein [Saprospiraceae bacterium]MBP9055218.1 OmpH family outer membrane protein [Saprospiraceae bacterium]
MNTKRIIIGFSLVLGLLVNIEAQKIAIVDINEVLSSLPEYQNAQTELDRIAAEWRQEIAQEFDKVKSMYNKFQAEQVLLSADDKTKKEDEIVKKESEVRELQKTKFGPDGALFKKRQEMVSPIQDKVFGAIESYAADRGFDIIFDKGGATGLLFTNPEYDKTADLKKRLNIK